MIEFAPFEAISYYWFVARWLWRNRDWADTRQKYKAMNRDWERHVKERRQRKGWKAKTKGRAVA